MVQGKIRLSATILLILFLAVMPASCSKARKAMEWKERYDAISAKYDVLNDKYAEMQARYVELQSKYRRLENEYQKRVIAYQQQQEQLARYRDGMRDMYRR